MTVSTVKIVLRFVVVQDQDQEQDQEQDCLPSSRCPLCQTLYYYYLKEATDLKFVIVFL